MLACACALPCAEVNAGRLLLPVAKLPPVPARPGTRYTSHSVQRSAFNVWHLLRIDRSGTSQRQVYLMKTRSFAKTGSGQTHRQNKKPHSYPTKRRVAAGLVTVSVSVRPTSFNARTPARSSSTFATLPARNVYTPGGTLEKHRKSDSAGWLIHTPTWVSATSLSLCLSLSVRGCVYVP